MEHLLKGANAPFSIIFQIHSIAKASKGIILEYIVISNLPLPLLPWLHPLPFLVSLPV